MSLVTTSILQAAQVGTPILLSQQQRGLQDILLPDGTSMENIVAHATIEERHSDEMDIVEHPVEQGAAITDHAYKLPSRITLRLGWSNSSGGNQILDLAASWASTVGGEAGQIVGGAYGALTGGLNLLNSSDQLKSIYESLLDLQRKRAIFSIYTPKRIYYNMMCKGLHTETEWHSANSLPIIMECQEIILTNTSTVSLPASQVANPGANASPINSGTKWAINRGNTVKVN